MNASSPAATGGNPETFADEVFRRGSPFPFAPVADELTLEKAREIPLADMNQAELTAVILHDPDLIERRTALRLLKLEILLDAENRIHEALRSARK